MGFPLDKSNIKFNKKNKCSGCENFRCTSYKYYKPSTANKNKNTRYNNYNHKYPFPSSYIMGPLPIYKSYKTTEINQNHNKSLKII